MMRAHRQRLTVSKDHELRVSLPPDFPTGLAEVIVLSDAAAAPQLDEQGLRSTALEVFFSLLAMIGPSGRSTREIDDQVRQERDAWEH
mgnify:CR=1 FL=1